MYLNAMKFYYAIKENEGKLVLWICLSILYEQIKNSIYFKILFGLGAELIGKKGGTLYILYFFVCLQ